MATATSTRTASPSIPESLPLSPEVRKFLSRPRPFLIGNQWVNAASGKTFPAYNPATGDVIAEVAEGDREDIERAVKAARKAFEGPWRRVTPAERTKMMWRLAELIEKHGEELAQLDTLNNGMPLAASRGMPVFAAEIIRYNAGWATKIVGETVPNSMPSTEKQGWFTYTLREPVGVVGQIIPWNAPTGLVAQKTAAALAAGCTIVLKPAEQTPLSALRMGELFLEAGFPEGVVNIVPGYGETAGAAIASHPDIDKVSFTGSTQTGKLIAAAALGNLKRVTLELGGKSPTVILDDADLEVAVPGAAVGAFANVGQLCTAAQRVYVHERLYDRFVEGVAGVAKKIKVGHGFDPATEMGPLISREQHERVLGLLESGRADGIQAVTGGKRHGDRGYFVEPTVLTGGREQMRIMREEIFGPVICPVAFADEAEIIRTANDTPYGLGAAVFTRDVARAHRVAHALKAGTVFVNAYHSYDAALPFGGFKQSGWGREFGKEGVEIYTEVKSVVVRT